jgi:hypothetical protein
MKKVFCNAPSSVVITFKEKLPTSPLLLQPVSTHWCTWLKAVEYYSENNEATKEIVQAFPDSDNTACIALVMETVKDINAETNIACIR